MTSRMTGSKYSLTSAGRQRGMPPSVWRRDASRRPPWRGGLPAPYVLPAGFAALLAVGTVAAALGGRLGATGVLIACALVVGVLAALAEPTAAIPLGVIGWLTAVGFSRPPYADLRLTGMVAGTGGDHAGGGGGRRGSRRRGVPLARGRGHTGRAWTGTSTAGSPGAGRWPARYSPWPGCRCLPCCSTYSSRTSTSPTTC